MFYLFHGTCDFSINEMVNELKAKVTNPNLNITTFDNEHTVTEISYAINQLPMLGNVRMIILKSQISQLGNKQVEKLINDVPDTTRLVFVEYRDTPPGAVKLFRKHGGYIKKFTPIKGQKLVKWIKDRLDVDNDVAVMLSGSYSSLYALQNELHRLSHHNGPITVDSLEKAQETDIFAVIDLIVNQQHSKALEHTDILADIPFQILALLKRQYQMISHIKAGITIKAHPYVVSKLKQVSKLYSFGQIAYYYDSVCEIDTMAKEGRTDPSNRLVLWLVENL